MAFVSRAPRVLRPTSAAPSSADRAARSHILRDTALSARPRPHGRSRRTATRCSADGFDDFVLTMQEKICREAAAADGSGKEFILDKWDRGEGGKNGFGITRVLQGGKLLEKAAANVSIVKGTLTAARAQAMSERGRDVDPAGGQEYSAAALSLVFHSAQPMIPTFRADVRYFQVDGGDGWYGGGADLTPFYLYEEDAKAFHASWKATCDEYGEHLYPAYKKWCDDYFYIPARKEHRGVGGIFYDDLMTNEAAARIAAQTDGDAEPLISCEDPQGFTEAVAEALMPSYLPIAEKRRGEAYTEEQRHWQLLRRGRYLEFNLLYDRGVKFGLDGGRIESIMVSGPVLAPPAVGFPPPVPAAL